MEPITVIGAGLATATVGSIRANSTSRNLTAAVTLIYDKVDQFRAMNPATNPVDLAPGSHTDPASPLTPLGSTGGAFTRTWTVSANTPRPGLAEVVVRISWSDPTPRSIQSVAYVCTTETCS